MKSSFLPLSRTFPVSLLLFLQQAKDGKRHICPGVCENDLMLQNIWKCSQTNIFCNGKLHNQDVLMFNNLSGEDDDWECCLRVENSL